MSVDRQRAQLAEALKRLRLGAGMSGYALAERLGVDQSTISKIERNKQRISITQVEQWCDATGAPAETRRELRDLAEAVLMRPLPSWREAGAGSTDFAQEIAELEAAAPVVSVYQPAVVPGLLQTATYARRVLSSGPDGEPADVAERVLGRLERQRILADQSKTIRFLIPEAVLRWPFGPPEEHVEQLIRIGEVMRRPNVDIRILPLRPNPAWRLSGFVMFGDTDKADLVHLELLSGPVDIDAPDQLDLYRRVFDSLAETALPEDDGAELLAAVIAELRQS